MTHACVQWYHIDLTLQCVCRRGKILAALALSATYGHSNSGHAVESPEPVFTLQRWEVEAGALVTYRRNALWGTERISVFAFLWTRGVEWFVESLFFARDVAALFCERGLNNIEGHTVPLIMYTLFHCVYSKLPGRDLLYCWRHLATPLWPHVLTRWGTLWGCSSSLLFVEQICWRETLKWSNSLFLAERPKSNLCMVQPTHCKKCPSSTNTSDSET